MKILFYIIPFLMTCCCSHESLEYKDLPESFYGKRIGYINDDSTKSIIEEIKDYNEFSKIGEYDSRFSTYIYDSKYFIISRKIILNYFENSNQSTDSLFLYVITIVDKDKETIEVLDSIDFRHDETDLYITEDYYYFRLLITGRGNILKPSDSLLVSGVLLFNKKNEYKLFKYYQNKIILLDQKDDLFHVVTAELSFKWRFLGKEFYSIFGGSSIKIKSTMASLVSNGSFTEYYYNQDLELVHSKNISEQKAIKLYKQSLKKRDKNIKQKE